MQQQNQKGAPPIESRPTKASHASLPTRAQLASSLAQGSRNLSHVQKKQRIIQQPQTEFQSKYTTHNEGLQHQQQLKQCLQSEVNIQEGQLQDYRQFNHKQEQDMRRIQILCTHQLLNYMFHKRKQPPDNSIIYWRKFVTKYYDPHARKRWCNANCALGVDPREAAGAWQCDICGLGPGKGIEAIFETLPRLLKIKFDSGVIDDHLVVDLPRTHILPFGRVMLSYDKAVQQSSYRQFHVLREGKLQVVFTEKLKILSWEFCTYHYEELFPRSLLTQLANHSDEVSEICQTPDAENESDGKPIDSSQTKCSVSQDTVSHSVDKLVSSTVNGFPKSYYQSCKISEVVNTMKDLMNFSRQHNLGPIASLQKYPQLADASKQWILKMKEREIMPCFQGQYTEHSSEESIP